MTLVRVLESSTFVIFMSLISEANDQRRVRHIAFISIFLQLANFVLLCCLAVSEEFKERAMVGNVSLKRSAMTPRSILLLTAVMPLLGMTIWLAIHQMFSSYELEAGYLPFAAECKATVGLSAITFLGVGLVMLLSGDQILVFTDHHQFGDVQDWTEADWESEKGRAMIKAAKWSDRKWTAFAFGGTTAMLVLIGLVNVAQNHPREGGFMVIWSPCFNDGVGT